MQSYGDNFSIVVPVDEDEFLHTADKPFCWNSTCPCHENQANIDELADYVTAGLASPDDANRIYQGRTV